VPGTAASRVARARIRWTRTPRRYAVGARQHRLDVGASVAVIHDAELVVDLWGGSIDVEGTRPWERDTITNVWSTTKTMTFLACLVLADRGEIDLHAPVARYWPEFAANGKADVTVAQCLSHTAGLPGWQEPITAADFEDWGKLTALLAAQAPWWTPGTASGYHAISQGYLLGEVVRRVTGQSFGAFFASELAGPLGADFHCGTGPEHDHRVALVIPNAPMDLEAMPAGSIPYRTFSNPPMTATYAHPVGWRRAEVPAANGHGNARSVALLQAIVSHGGELHGRRFLSEAGCRRALELQVDGTDLVLGIPARIGMGYGLAGEALPLPPSACFWGGWGGSLAVNDLDARMTFAYVMNKMGEGTVGDLRGGALLLAAYGALAEA
jgi:CubicO group peptidase (beta-lactamase class C family)